MALAVTLAAFFVPGIVLSFALLHGLSLTRLEKLLLGVIVSVSAIPSLEIMEFVFFGVQFSPLLVLANYLLVLVAGIALLAHQGGLPQLQLRLPQLPADVSWFNKQRIVQLLLIALLVFSFWARISTSWAHNFFEFDPIYYSHVTEILVKDGSVPLASTEVYYPSFKNQRVYPLVIYLGASFYAIYHSIAGGDFIKQDFSLVVQTYPPLVGMLLVFIAFLLFRHLANEYFGLIAAGVASATPQMVVKFGAGVNELQPWGLFSALFLVTAIAFAVTQKSYRLALLAGLASFTSVIGSAQNAWPLMIATLFIFLYSIINYLRDELDIRLLVVYAAIVLPQVFGALVMAIYQGRDALDVGTSQMLLLASFAGALLFYGIGLAVDRYLPRESRSQSRLAGLGALALLTLVVALVFPAATGRAVDTVNGLAGFARQLSALGMTIAEENPTNPGLYFGVFGYLNPDILLSVTALLVAVFSIAHLLRNNRVKAAIAVAGLGLLVSALNPVFDAVFLFISNTFFSSYPLLTQFIVGSDVFAYMLLAIFSILAAMLLTREQISPTVLLLTIVIFPVAYIGLNKLKFLPHLALALVIAFPFALFLGYSIVELLSSFLSRDSDKTIARKSILAIVIVIGGLVFFAQAGTVQTSMQNLGFSRISSDWLGAYEWMRTTPTMAREACAREYGYDCRVLSWWDYGHWTTYFGEKNSVLDPGNAHPDYDQEVARAFVNGNLEDMLYTVRFHQATHVLVDAELIQKWGALVFLSGSCSRKLSPTCPEAPEIDFTSGAGRSTYEAGHYFEMLQSSGQCPSQLTGVALPAFRSSLTQATYCFTNDEYLLLTQRGIDSSFKRKYKILGRDQVDTSNLDSDTSYLFGFANNQFLNANPDLSYVGIDNNVVNAAFTRLFLFESLPGFQMEHRSPRGEVKIFKITKDFINGKTLAQVSRPGVPDVTPTPLPAPAPTPVNETASTAANASTATNLTANLTPSNLTQTNATNTTNTNSSNASP